MNVDISDFVSVVQIKPPVALLRINGELDAFTTRQVSGQVHDAVSAGCVELRVDLAGVTFIDASGIGLLVRLHNTAADNGGRLQIIAASSCVLRLCALLELTDVLAFRSEAPRGSDRNGPMVTLRRIRPRWRRTSIA